jgi:hypothetical protein
MSAKKSASTKSTLTIALTTPTPWRMQVSASAGPSAISIGGVALPSGLPEPSVAFFHSAIASSPRRPATMSSPSSCPRARIPSRSSPIARRPAVPPPNLNPTRQRDERGPRPRRAST